MVKIKIDLNKCDGDGTCVSVCPVEVYELQTIQGKKKAVAVNADACIVCRACENECPNQAIEVTEE
jgi:NAD-dependent dihydropyrimidine dehydrogenase PreA subunit